MEILRALAPFLNKIAPWVLGWLAGFRSPQAFALRRYQRRLSRMYSTFTPKSGPAGRELSMREMYLPLQVEESGRTNRLSIQQVIAKFKRVIVTGEPGAGKSMLLHNLAFEFATDRRAARRANIPIILEIRHLEADTAKPLQDHLVDQLKRVGFFRPEKFVERALHTGRLRVLLDGLDEVGERAAVCQRILDFMRDYRECHVVVTCRTAVQEKALWTQMHVVAVADLDNQLIQDFVGMSLGQDQPGTALLLDELFANPRLLALARIPLLLTMMVGMYAGQHQLPARLPASRAQFYLEAIDFLLTPWKAEQTTDTDLVDDKRRVLRHLALAGPTSSRDIAVSQVAILLRYNNKAARDLLREIVERSGLLRRSDDGYQFAHQSFQEFLAAEALRDDAQRPLDLFRGDPDRWQETVVLWCGIVRDPTAVVEGLLRDGYLVALESLSDVRELDQRIVRQIIEEFSGQLDHADPGSPTIRAFGVAASGTTTAAQTIFEFLAREVEHAPTRRRRAAAAHALAISSRQPAADLLGRLYGSFPEVRKPLERMRDLAIAPLVAAARSGDGNAVDSLRSISTPMAVHALVDLLWNLDDQIAARAAWALATMLPNPSVEKTLADYPLAVHGGGYWWGWEPFTRSLRVRRIVSRIAYLLKEGPEPDVADERPIDGRLAIALGFVDGGSLVASEVLDDPEVGAELMSVLHLMEQESGRDDLIHKMRGSSHLIDEVFEPLGRPGWTDLQRRLLLTYVQALKWGKRERLLLARAPTEYLVEVFQKYRYRAPENEYWRLMFKKGLGLWPVVIGFGAIAIALLGWLIVLTIVQTSRSFFPAGGFALPSPTWLWWSPFVVATIGATLLWWFESDRKITLRVLLELILAVAVGAAFLLAIVLFFVMPSVWLQATTGKWQTVVVTWIGAGGWLFYTSGFWIWQRMRDTSPLKGGLSASGTDQRVA